MQEEIRLFVVLSLIWLEIWLFVSKITQKNINYIEYYKILGGEYSVWNCEVEKDSCFHDYYKGSVKKRREVSVRDNQGKIHNISLTEKYPDPSRSLLHKNVAVVEFKNTNTSLHAFYFSIG